MDTVLVQSQRMDLQVRKITCTNLQSCRPLDLLILQLAKGVSERKWEVHRGS
jgi:hypothetical protein